MFRLKILCRFETLERDVRINDMATITKLLLTLTLSVFVLTACNNPVQQINRTSPKINLEDSTLTDSKKQSQAVDSKDTIIYDYNYYPIIDSAKSVKVLTVGSFHNDEVWENADKEKWLGLFKGKTNFYVAETKLKIRKVFDAILDKENEETGWEVQTANKDSAIILFEKLNFLTERNVEQAILSKEEIFPNDTLKVNYLGVDYKIYATGGKRKVQDDPEWFVAWNYKLYISANIKGQELKTLLVAQPNFDDNMINIIFAGDIDGDGILDLIIDTSRHYNSECPTIYLSKPADNGEIEKPVGKHEIVGC